MVRRLLIGVVLLCVGAACRGLSYPTSPTIESASLGPQATNLLLSAAPDRLPIAGGDATITVRAITRNAAGVESGVAGVRVTIESTEGTLDLAELTTDTTGTGVVRWRTTKTGTVVARAGSLDGTVTITVATPESPLPPPTKPPPAPAPEPLPPPPPPPPPNPTMTVTLSADPSSIIVGESVTFTATANPSADAGSIRGYEWDFGDGSPGVTTSSATTTHRYTAVDSYTARVTARTTAWQTGTGSAVVTVTPVPPPVPPALSVTLTADPSTVAAGGTVAFTATPSNLNGETVDSYQWDFDGNGTFDATTTSNTRTHIYPTQGVFTAKVRIITTTDRTAEGTRRVTVESTP